MINLFFVLCVLFFNSGFLYAKQFSAVDIDNDYINIRKNTSVKDQIRGKLDAYYVDLEQVQYLESGAEINQDKTNYQLVSSKRTIVGRKGSAVHERWENTYMSLTKESKSNDTHLFKMDVFTESFTETVNVYRDTFGDEITEFEYSQISIPVAIPASPPIIPAPAPVPLYSLANCTPIKAPASLTGSVVLLYYYNCDGKTYTFLEPLK